MTASPVAGRRARPPGFPLSWALLPIVILLTGALGFWIVSTVWSSNSGLAEASEQATSAPPSGTHAAVTTQATVSRARFTEITGLEVLWVAVSGAGGILDLRYRAVDEKKASAHARHQSVPAIIDSKTGKALTRQWMGHAAHASGITAYQGDRNYWMLFRNENELVKQGDRVTVRLGLARLTGVRVR